MYDFISTTAYCLSAYCLLYALISLILSCTVLLPLNTLSSTEYAISTTPPDSLKILYRVSLSEGNGAYRLSILPCKAQLEVRAVVAHRLADMCLYPARYKHRSHILRPEGLEPLQVPVQLQSLHPQEVSHQSIFTEGTRCSSLIVSLTNFSNRSRNDEGFPA